MGNGRIVSSRQQILCCPAEDNDSDNDNNNDNNNNNDNDNDGGGFTVDKFGEENSEIKHNQILLVDQKIRKAVAFFKRSPTKYEKYLQKYLREQFGKDLVLLMVVKTRRNIFFYYVIQIL